MRYSGTLVQWNDERGFGWIEADSGGERLFVHISAFEPRPSAEQRPQPGLRLQFAVGLEQGKKRALQVAWRIPSQGRGPSADVTRRIRGNNQSTGRVPSSRAASQGWHASSRFSYGALLCWMVLMLVTAVIWGVPRILWLVYAGLSALTFMVYWQDKWSAQKGQWRTPEKTLQLLALAGGWPGAVLAQQWLRHKSSKTRFQLEFWLMVLINVAAVLWLCSPYGRFVWI